MNAPRDMEGWHGWEQYAPFYDWENARTVGRRDIRFWQHLAKECGGPVLELGCGTGRVSLPVARVVGRVVGIDRSHAMLKRAWRRVRRADLAHRLSLVRGDIRALPFITSMRFRLVMAPYGVLQSLLRDRDLRDVLASVRGVLQPGGTFAIDLVPELSSWREYTRRVTLRGQTSGGTRVRLVESVRQDPSRKLTSFDQEFIEGRGLTSRSHRFTLVFRSLSVRQMTGRLRRAGFRIGQVAGDYQRGGWHPEADICVIVSKRD